MDPKLCTAVLVLMCSLNVAYSKPNTADSFKYVEDVYYGTDRKIHLTCDAKPDGEKKIIKYRIFKLDNGEKEFFTNTFANDKWDFKIEGDYGVTKEKVEVKNNGEIIINTPTDLEKFKGTYACTAEDDTKSDNSNQVTIGKDIERVNNEITVPEGRKDKTTFNKNDKVTVVCSWSLLTNQKLEFIAFKQGGNPYYRYKPDKSGEQIKENKNFAENTVTLQTKEDTKASVEIKDIKEEAKGDFICELNYKADGKDPVIPRPSQTITLQYGGSGAGATVASIGTIIVSLLAFLKTYY